MTAREALSIWYKTVLFVYKRCTHILVILTIEATVSKVNTRTSHYKVSGLDVQILYHAQRRQRGGRLSYKICVTDLKSSIYRERNSLPRASLFSLLLDFEYVLLSLLLDFE